ncbi:MAG: hypothetical protein GJ680_21170 [Alteromonadaceae bacterium]|nr:hypothetical protein [Alteromonadaceae bacterium]
MSNNEVKYKVRPPSANTEKTKRLEKRIRFKEMRGITQEMREKANKRDIERLLELSASVKFNE